MSQEIKKYIDQLNLIYYGLIALPLVLFPVVYLPMKDGVSNDFGEGTPGPYYLAAVLLFLVVIFARRLFRRSLQVIQSDWQLRDKLKAYRRITVIFNVLGLFSCLLSVGLLLFTRHQLFVATYPILLLILSLYRPTVERMKRDLPFTEKDLAMIENQG